MAKEYNIHPAWLCGISAALLSAGWLMKPFPLFIFAGVAPLFAITDHARNEARFWNLSELILLALARGLMAVHFFAPQFLVLSLVQAIALTLAFLGHSFAYQRLGPWAGKFTIIIFWLALEYAFLRLPWRDRFIFLGDALVLKPTWLKWNEYTGYLGSSLWILLVNLFLYLAVFRGKKISWGFLAATIACITGPMIYAHSHEGAFISRNDMILLYSHRTSGLSSDYVRLGELIAVTAAGIAVLILVASFLRTKDLKE